MIKAFDELEAQLHRTIAIGLYDVERYSKMEYKDFCDEEHVEQGDLAQNIREQRLNSARRDIELAQQNLKLLANTKEKYANNGPTDDFIEIARRTLGVFDEKRGRVSDAGAAGPEDAAHATQGRRDDGDGSGDSGAESQGSEGGHTDRDEAAFGDTPDDRGGKGKKVEKRAGKDGSRGVKKAPAKKRGSKK